MLNLVKKITNCVFRKSNEESNIDGTKSLFGSKSNVADECTFLNELFGGSYRHVLNKNCFRLFLLLCAGLLVRCLNALGKVFPFFNRYESHFAWWSDSVESQLHTSFKRCIETGKPLLLSVRRGGGPGRWDSKYPYISSDKVIPRPNAVSIGQMD